MDSGDQTDISIHAPREGRDATSAQAVEAEPEISIHAPREGRDAASI